MPISMEQQMQPIKVSVVIPVYNAARYLRECLDSVVNQTLKEIEIICVDDGSTDDSLSILQEYKTADPRFQVYHQQNKYAGAARNNGLEHASGEYVIFWDSDDYFSLNALESMYSLAKERQADLCICNAQNFDSETGEFLAHNYVRKPYPETDVFNINDCKERIYTFTSTVPWNKMIRRQFMMEENIRFQGTKHINDVLASLLVLSLAKRITLCKKRLIYYRMNRADSLMSTYGEKLDSVMLAYEETARELAARGILDDPDIRQSLADKAVGVYFFTMPYVNNYEQYRNYFDRMTNGDSLVKTGSGNLHENKNMAKYLAMLEQTPEEFLFSEYQRLTRLSEEKQQTIASLKSSAKKDGKRIEKLVSSEEKLKEKVTVLKEEKESAKAEQKRLQEMIEQMKQAQTKLQDETKSIKKELLLQQKALQEADRKLQTAEQDLAASEKSLSRISKEHAAYEKELRKLETENAKLRASWSFRIGQMIVWLPGKIKRLFGFR